MIGRGANERPSGPGLGTSFGPVLLPVNAVWLTSYSSGYLKVYACMIFCRRITRMSWTSDGKCALNASSRLNSGGRSESYP